MGKTGVATARFLAARDAILSLTDKMPADELQALLDSKGLQRAGTVVPYDLTALDGIDLIIPSPGVPPANPLLREAVKQGIPIISEMELAYRFLSVPIIAITGTNGKTTTTTLIGKILEWAGKKVFVGGNIGDPLIGFAGGSQDADYAVVEVSSFQLEWTERFCPAVAVLLNTTCDHVDYHGSFAAYRQAKERIFANQNSQHLAIINGDEETSRELQGRLTPRTCCFSSRSSLERGIFVTPEEIVYIPETGPQESFPLAMVKIPGRHNLENVMAAIVATRDLGVSADHIRDVVTDFRGLPHRIEWVAEKGGVDFYDDSKGTNVDAVVRALESFSRPVVLLMGGRDKDGDFETLVPLLAGRVRELIMFGEAREKISKALGGIVPASVTPTLGEAVLLAGRHALSGDIVLLSPGCASFDEFTDYKARGNFFRGAVSRLP